MRGWRDRRWKRTSGRDTRRLLLRRRRWPRNSTVIAPGRPESGGARLIAPSTGSCRRGGASSTFASVPSRRAIGSSVCSSGRIDGALVRGKWRRRCANAIRARSIPWRWRESASPSRGSARSRRRCSRRHRNTLTIAPIVAPSPSRSRRISPTSRARSLGSGLIRISIPVTGSIRAPAIRTSSSARRRRWRSPRRSTMASSGCATNGLRRRWDWGRNGGD